MFYNIRAKRFSLQFSLHYLSGRIRSLTLHSLEDKPMFPNGFKILQKILITFSNRYVMLELQIL